jgi:hypothetical protein
MREVSPGSRRLRAVPPVIMYKIRRTPSTPGAPKRRGRIFGHVAVSVFLTFASLPLPSAALAAENVTRVDAAKTRGPTKGTWWEVIDPPEQLNRPAQATSTIAVRVELQSWRSSNTKQIDFPVPGEGPGEIALIYIEGMQHQGVKGGSVWRATVAGDDASVATFSVFDDGMVGDVRTSQGKMYRISYAAPNIVFVMTLDPKKFPPEEKAIKPSREQNDTRESR